MRLWIRRGDLRRVGAVKYLTCDATLRANGVGAWSFTVDASARNADKILPGRGVYAYDRGVIFSGPITSIRESGGTVRTLEVSGVTDEEILRRRVVYPDPTSAGDSQGAAAYWSHSGVRETLLRQMVSVNAGETALPTRSVPGLDTGTSSGLGGAGRVNERFTVLLDAVNELAADKLIWRIIHDDQTPALRLEVFEGVDRSRSVRFSRKQGSLSAYEWDDLAPSITDVIVAGQGEGEARTLIERSASSTWGRFESFQDRRDTDDIAQLEQAGDETLAENGPSASLKFSVVETPLSKRYGHHYRVGDTVTAVLKPRTQTEPEVAVSDVVREAKLSWTAQGRTVELTVGDQSQDDITAAMVEKIRDLQRRLRRSEGR